MEAASAGVSIIAASIARLTTAQALSAAKLLVGSRWALFHAHALLWEQFCEDRNIISFLRTSVTLVGRIRAC